ncbi:MAG: hypothetical protein F6K28_16200 [Microcoleus sp. SIO2G3]|nr:hypothetical protein [Microcoleus sp. SIO2G3]
MAPTTTNVPNASTYTEAQGWVIGQNGEVILMALNTHCHTSYFLSGISRCL